MKYCLFSLLFSLALLPAPRSSAQAQSLPMTEEPLVRMDGFRPHAGNWQIVGGVSAGLDGPMETTPGTGALVNLPRDGATDNLFSAWEHGDLELDLEFMMPKGSNSGIYLQGRYEIQLLDSWGVQRPSFADLGGIYQRWNADLPEGARGFEGQAPLSNASRAPGLWQHMNIRFQAPRFDDSGRKTANAKIVEVLLNGVVIHRNVDLTGPTRGSALEGESPTGPLMIQGDHGEVAFRRIQYKRFRPSRVSAENVSYRYAEGIFEAIPDLKTGGEIREGTLPGIDWRPAAANEFAMEFSGRVTIPATDQYRFRLKLDWVTGDPHDQASAIAGARLVIGDRVVLNHSGQDPAVSGDVDLEAGAYPFTLTYFKNKGWGPRSISLDVEASGMPLHSLNVPGAQPSPPSVGAIIVEPGAEPALIRGFVRHGGTKKTHVISVGDERGVHYSMDLAQGALLQVWKGDFIETTDMWHSRGTEQLAVPLGGVIALPGTPTVAQLTTASAVWPDTVGASYRFRGYDLSPDGHPTFHYDVDNLKISDGLLPSDAGRRLTRTISISGSADGAWINIASGRQIETMGDGTFAVDDRTYYLVMHPESAAPQLRDVPGGRQLLVPVSSGEATVARFDLVW